MAYDLGTIGSAVKLDNRPFLNGINQMQSRTATVLTGMQGAFLRVFGTLGVIKVFKDATTASMDFGEALSNVVSIADELNIQDVRKEITGLNSVLGTSTELTESFYRAYSAGARGSAAELANFTAEISKLSKAIRADQVATMEAATKLMNSYGLEVKDAGEVSDTLFQIVKLGATTGQEIAGTIGLVANTASVAKIPLNELGAAIAVLTRTMPTSRAIVSLNQVITSFLDPTKEAKEVAEGLGTELSATALQSQGFANMIEQINEKAGDNVEALNLMFGNVRAFRAIASLAGEQAKTFKDVLEEFGDKGGSALKAFEVQTDNTKTTWTTSMVEMNKALINFGDAIAPIVTDLSTIITEVSEGVQALEGWEVQLGLGAIAASLIIGKMRSFSMAAAQNATATTQAGAAVAQTAGKATAAAVANANYTASINLNTQALIANMNAAGQRSFLMQQEIINTQRRAALRMTLDKQIKAGFESNTRSAGRFATAIKGMGGTMGILQGAMIAIPVAMASWKFGRWIADVTGLDKALTDMYGTLFTNRDKLLAAGQEKEGQAFGLRVADLKQDLIDLQQQFPKSGTAIDEFRKKLQNIQTGDLKGVHQLGQEVSKFGKTLVEQATPQEIPLTDLVRFKIKDPALVSALEQFTDEQADKFKRHAEFMLGEGNLGQLAGRDSFIRKLITELPDIGAVLASEDARHNFKKQLDLMENDILSFQIRQQQILAGKATGELTEEQAREQSIDALEERQATHILNIKALREQQFQIMKNGTEKEKEAVLEALKEELEGYKSTTDQIKGLQDEVAKNSPLKKLQEQLRAAGGVQELRESIFKDDKVTAREGRAFMRTLTPEQRKRGAELFEVAKGRGMGQAEASREALRALSVELRDQNKLSNSTQEKQLVLLEKIGNKIVSGEGAILLTD